MDRTAIITGASGGIGAEVARELARRSWRIAVVGRNPERTREVARMTEGIPFICDFDDLEAVRELGDTLSKRFDRIDAIVNNAGGIVATRQESSEGHELTLQRNVLGSVVLTERLIPKLLTPGVGSFTQPRWWRGWGESISMTSDLVSGATAPDGGPTRRQNLA